MNKIKVQPNEVTCRDCGETFPASWSGCPRCTQEEPTHTNQYRRTPTVPTVSYLNEWEYVHAA